MDEVDKPGESFILVVEDDEAIRSVLVEALVEEMGLAAVGAGGGADALALMSERRPNLVLLDLTLPDLAGLDVLRRIRASPDGRSVPVVTMTALSSDDGQSRAALDGGSVALLEKPFDVDDLIAVVGAVLRGEPPPAGRRR